MVLNCHDLSKSFDGKDILKGVSFHLEDNEKAAIVGINGAGKTTLIRMIIGELTPDTGTVTLSRDTTVGYLAQNQNIDSAHSIYEELREMKRDVIELEKEIRKAETMMDVLRGEELDKLMERYAQMNHEFQMKNGYAWESEVIGVAKGLGFSEEEFDKRISTLSGGQKTRVALGKLLLQSPDLIILDEPTNHLDMNSIKWLEGYLINYKGAVLIVSHDRYFLDRIAQKVIEIDQTSADVYIGNYSAYAKKREQIRAAKLKAYLNQQAEIKHQEEVIEKLKQFNREKSIKRAESREKMLDKIERLEKPTEVRDDMRITLTPSCVSGNDVMQVDSISKSFGNEKLFENISFEIKRGEKVAIIGDNGTGKTTMLKIINGMETLDDGEITLGVKVHIGYYDQEHQVLHEEKTLFEELSDAYPSMSNTEIRNTLAAFLFTGDDVFKRIGDLSGGEKGRVSLAKLMLSEANFLILDEPTNHLDITSKEILEDALSGYEGTVLYVSHDRYFINKTATRILDLTHGRMINYLGNYDYYMEHSEEQTARVLSESGDASSFGREIDMDSKSAASGNSFGKLAGSSSQADNSGSGAADWKAQKEEAAKKRKQEAALKKCEDEIAKLEERNEKINVELTDPDVATDLAKVRKLSDELTSNEERLNTLYDEWAELSEGIK
ncbi:ABC-F family ATP-binding cassette domain-containing protein [Butyrivibrio sp. JL13D10]|uniref:ABC-F family ATP-binding cassette domain-containing protein n=1 Tax=Butyrivibrio sp. JL13D10 TaxID=3236815 RepID=UPI0038B5E8CB